MVIRHLHMYDNTNCPLQILHKHCLSFLLGRLKLRGVIKNNWYVKYWGGGAGGGWGTMVFMGDLQMKTTVGILVTTLLSLLLV